MESEVAEGLRRTGWAPCGVCWDECDCDFDRYIRGRVKEP